MNKITVLSLLAGVGISLAAGVAGAESGGVHWSYAGQAGPDKWGTLDAKFAACDQGKNQSPINIASAIEAKLAPIVFNYSAAASEILNNGHTIQVNFAPGSAIRLDDKVFELKQVHFHTPSENHIEGTSFPMEAHFVHASADKELAVIGVMYTMGESNGLLAKLWAEMPTKANDKQALKAKVNSADLLPKKRDYYRFNGSLTTPPCSEGVRWLVMKAPLTIAKAQVDQFAQVMHHPNNRPLQPVHARPVLQ